MTVPPQAAPVAADSFTELARHVDQLRDQVAHSDPRSQELLKETIDAITEFNRRGLAILVQMLREDDRAAEVLYAAVDRPEVMALFVSHGLIRSDQTLDVLQVVEQIRPHLVASSIDMEVESVSDGIAYVRFPTGCSAPDQEVKDEVMGVIRQRVPGLREVREIEQQAGGAFIAVDTIRVGPPS